MRLKSLIQILKLINIFTPALTIRILSIIRPFFQVQNPAQYKYLYQCIAKYLRARSSDPLYQNEVAFDEKYIYEEVEENL